MVTSPSSWPARRLLMIDDDVELCGLVEKLLAHEGIAVELVHDGPEGLDAALGGHHDAIILDVMLPGLGGFDILRKVREHQQTPILMLTARGDHVDRVVGLEMGADDYIPKPFDPRELVARIRAVLRRSEAAPATATPPPAASGEQVVVGEIVADPATREARRGARLLQLTPNEFDLLVMLMRSVGRPLSGDELCRGVLGRPLFRGDGIIKMYITNLRRKLGKGAGGGSAILTARGAGYLMSPPGGEGAS
jgi:two-component system, OmpR family, response regulator CpxR